MPSIGLGSDAAGELYRGVAEAAAAIDDPVALARGEPGEDRLAVCCVPPPWIEMEAARRERRS